MSEIYCNQIKCKETTCDFHPIHQPWDDPVRVYDMRGRCNGKPMRLEQVVGKKRC